MKKVFKKDFYGTELVVETGKFAKQATGACMVRYGDTAVLSASVIGREPSRMDFFPLMVIYQEKLYSAGKIPGGFLRREGRPTEHETLISRAIDRPLRPLFSEGFRYEVQVINTVMSADPNKTPEMTALFGASLSLKLGGVPFEGPVAGVMVGYKDGEFILNPTPEELLDSEIDLIVAGTKDAINMVEAGAKEVDEDIMLDAIMFGHDKIKELVAFQEEIIAEVGKETIEVELLLPEDSLIKEVHDLEAGRITKAVSIKEKLERQNTIEDIEKEIQETLEAKYLAEGMDKYDVSSLLKDVRAILEEIQVKEVRRLITEDKIRPDGRKTDEIRDLESEIDILKRAHGSSLFTRGQTQALATVTLGALRESQIIDDISVDENKRFMLHYNFPQFSVGSTGRYGGPGRREIGHGALGERALYQVLPDENEFPYAIRVVSEILESNGSSSQATICAGSMALMAAGVPIKAPVAGIAMGLVMDGDNYTVLTDIQGLEDHFGDMDFKVAGTEKGICSLQMDIKISGITKAIFKESLAQAKKARMEILENMNGAIKEPRKELSEFAPKVKLMQVSPDKIRDIIGAGGKNITAIIEQCNNVKIDIEQDGRIILMHEETFFINKAMKLIEDIIREVEVGEKYLGKVTRIEKFGAFVELWPGQEGLVHISKLDNKHIKNVEDVVKLGDTIEVKVIKVDEKGRVDLSRKDVLNDIKE
ncbi:MAG: polyribonucleotide nucleotidyltransferase [Candidatus Izemoplasmatales bacterium]|uniref:Polyribonucleotide nucleotidyltransferase n=1 Tax=Hujiaoplasma nucleasis TaxID=2725268 RepID=A0A7L6N539_9MOLU|nr:polyribonucleotide nucleotidyltransferase [Hujiaoplasma nucleasis]QLY39614.1 polyribonucleotide nucleotidyltransferase [Hujiaoplasma nucleasis]